LSREDAFDAEPVKPAGESETRERVPEIRVDAVCRVSARYDQRRG
jgi:hypothetical protein